MSLQASQLSLLRVSFESKFPNHLGFDFKNNTYELTATQDYDHLSVVCLEYRSAWRAWQAAYSTFVLEADVVAGVIQVDPDTYSFPQFYLNENFYKLPLGDYKLIVKSDYTTTDSVKEAG